MDYPDLRANDARGLTYTSDPLPEPLQVTGHPVAVLWVTASEADADFFVYLEDVGPDGRSQYVTEGVLRASHRAKATPDHENFDLPHHSSTAASVVKLPPQPVELKMELLPTSYWFAAGTISARRSRARTRTMPRWIRRGSLHESPCTARRKRLPESCFPG